MLEHSFQYSPGLTTALFPLLLFQPLVVWQINVQAIFLSRFPTATWHMFGMMRVLAQFLMCLWLTYAFAWRCTGAQCKSRRPPPKCKNCFRETRRRLRAMFRPQTSGRRSETRTRRAARRPPPPSASRQPRQPLGTWTAHRPRRRLAKATVHRRLLSSARNWPLKDRSGLFQLGCQLFLLCLAAFKIKWNSTICL